MAVNLSPVFGVAGQLFDNNGNPLAGGKIFTYLAGTTTNAAVYTSSSGSIAHSNPIILDGAGRVPSGEIWLTDGILYKFVVQDSANNLIGTYDNLSGINSNFVAFTNQQQIITATAGQTVFNLSISYQPGTNSLSVFVDGVNQYGPGAQYAYVETDSDTVTFVSGLHVGASVKFTTSQLNSSGAVDASQVSYTPPFVDSVATNVEAKLAQYVSIKDFGAIGDGSVDDTQAINDAINSGVTDILIPEGTYKITSGISIPSTCAVRNITGAGNATIKLYTAVQASVFEIGTDANKQFLNISNLILDSNGNSGDGLQTYGILALRSSYLQFNNIRATNFSGAGLECRGCVYVGIGNYTSGSCRYGLSFQKFSGTQNTAMRVDRAYISGSTRGFTDDSGVDITVNDLVLEYSGSTSTTDGALHLISSTIILDYPYWEANNRNVVSTDSLVQMRNHYGWGTGTAADVISYVGVSVNERGWDVTLAYKHTMARLDADSYTNRDLVIGTNLTVPLAGGSVIFGNQTMAVASGTLTSATWTTVYTIPAAEVTGTAVNALAMYEYTCYAGSADLSTGFDSGTIMNGTLRSYSGTTPAWLRLSSNLVQMNVTNTSYGLNYKIVMRRMYPG
jgi:hypothetical protein